ncbi:putative ORFan [Tupanvirus deep ocean]|uniref:ORFan n=2 Tax=Tupanvirus TaxID=2094720 RepID=A0AC62A9L2_9VIRU|nr:putative ORFan [Tupanvirus deep ocean]QKU34362.1 putative ORFan [Tupanvirus deep ocean]
MTLIWIIHTGFGGNICDKVILKTKHKSKVGKYIRENLADVFFMFIKLCVCNNYGSIREDLDFLYGNDPELDIYNEDDREAIIEKISEVLDSYTNEEIVDELYGSSSDSEKDYAAITKFSVNEIITL